MTENVTNLDEAREGPAQTMSRINMKNDIHKVLGVQPRTKEATDRYMGRVSVRLTELQKELSAEKFSKAIGTLSDDARNWINAELHLDLGDEDQGEQRTEGTMEAMPAPTLPAESPTQSDLDRWTDPANPYPAGSALHAAAEAAAAAKAGADANVSGEQPPVAASPAQAEASEAKPALKPRAQRKGADVTGAIKRIVFNNPRLESAEVETYLAGAGVHAAKSTVQTVRADFLHSLGIIVKLGVQLPSQFEGFFAE